jgi:capsular exopolysaccharide synthesis family protein
MEAEIDIRAVLGVLRRQIRLVLGVFIVVSGVAAAIVFTLTPLYTATTLVMVDPSDKNLLVGDRPVGAVSANDPRIEGEVMLARSDSVLLEVIAREDLINDPEFQSAPGVTTQLLNVLRLREPVAPTPEQALRQTLSKLSSMVSVQRQGLTLLIAISARSEDPDRAASIANAIARAYIDSQLGSKVQNIVDARNMLLAQVAAARETAVESDGALERYIAANLETIVDRTGNADIADVEGAMLSGALPADMLAEIYDLQRQSELARQQYDQLVARAQHLQVEASLQLADSRVVSPALRPSEAAWPNTRTLMLLAGLGGLALGVALAFAYEYYVGGVTAPEQLAGLIKANNVVAVPRIKLNGDESSLADLLITKPLSAYAEAIRRMRASIEQGFVRRNHASEGAGNIVVVTSTAPSEGKTTLALSLARSYALSGRKVLLIDGDLRQPSLHHHIGMQIGDGLVEILRLDDPLPSLSSSLVRDEETGLMVLLTPQRSDLPTDDLIASRPFDRLLEAARNTFDIVVLDTPPLGPVVDALYLARHADAVVYVVQWAATSQSDIRHTYQPFKDVLKQGACVVPILNQQDMGSMLYFRRYGHYYHEVA